MAEDKKPGRLARSIALVGLILILPATLLHAQVFIEGNVSDATGATKLAGAHISVKDSYLATITDSKGHYRLSIGKPGKIVIRVSYIGFQSIERTVQIENSRVEVNFRLEEMAILGEEATITATRAGERSPAAFTNLDARKIAELNTGQDVPYLLNMTPGVVLNSDAGTGIGYTSFRIRGTDMNRINITMNGIPLNDAESHGVWWVDMPDFASSVDNLQIQRGVGTSSNGAAAFGASINLQTTTPKSSPYAMYSNSFGSFGTLRNSIALGTGMINGNWNIEGRLSNIRSDGFIDRAFADLNSYYLGAGYYGANTIIRAKVFSGKERTYQAWDGVPSAILDTNRSYNGIGAYSLPDGSIAYYDNETDNYRQDHYQLFFTHKLSASLNINLALHYTKGYGYYEQYKDDRRFSDYQMEAPIVGTDTLSISDLITRKYLDNHFYGMIYSAEWKKGHWDIIAGGGVNRYDGDHFGKVIWAEWNGQPWTDHEWYRSTGIKQEINSYLKASYEISPALFAIADVQLRNISHDIAGLDDDLRDISQEHSYTFFNPKAGIHFAPSDRHDLFLRIAVAHREPNRSNFTDANPELEAPRPEKLTDYEAGYRFRSGRFMLNATLYYMSYIDQLVLTGEINDVGAAIMTNVDRSYRAGIEVEAEWHIRKNLVWNANFALSRNRIPELRTYIDDWDTWTQREEVIRNTDIAFSPPVVAGSVISWEPLKGFSMKLISKYVSAQYIDNTSSAEHRLDAFFVNNVRLGYMFSLKGIRQAEISLNVNNILNEEYETNAWVYRYYETGELRYLDGYFPQAGVHILAGLSILL